MVCDVTQWSVIQILSTKIVWCKTTRSPDSAFVDTVFISLFSTVLIIKWTEDFTGMFMNFGSYFFWKIFPFMNEEQRHRDIKNNIIFSFWSIWREWKGCWFCLFVGWFVSPSLRIVIFSITQLPKYLTHSSQWLHLQFLQFWKFLKNDIVICVLVLDSRGKCSRNHWKRVYMYFLDYFLSHIFVFSTSRCLFFKDLSPVLSSLSVSFMDCFPSWLMDLSLSFGAFSALF